MVYNWETCNTTTTDFVNFLLFETKEILRKNFIGFYIHGSLAMGGFNPSNSDIDLLVVTKHPIDTEMKKQLKRLFLKCSGNPYPIEISFLVKNHLINWQHPCPFDFHFSEYWRNTFESEGFNHLGNGLTRNDPDLAAHITITNQRGICVDGEPICEVFPVVPDRDYISSIMNDYEDCLENLRKDPIYCLFNLIRVYWYLKDGVISSKLEAGRWAQEFFPEELQYTLGKLMGSYTQQGTFLFNQNELILLKDYIDGNVKKLLES
ncbi:aminoglycoside adenylyltransferase domain-containing protein [Virgibacillus siamensis]|uniref:aminoglycoside adenylyltransferase domain-containing protein n=1 Tax=Virgibacillus siamensis TaxID=480071 RepID=UPI000986F5C4|nr:aminoglycoside adenylyltransferase domain-containing protein [Virgibacillus siamensis]